MRTTAATLLDKTNAYNGFMYNSFTESQHEVVFGVTLHVVSLVSDIENHRGTNQQANRKHVISPLKVFL